MKLCKRELGAISLDKTRMKLDRDDRVDVAPEATAPTCSLAGQ